MTKLKIFTKRQVKVLKEMWKHTGTRFSRAIEWRGKYYWGDYESYSRPIGTKTLEELCALGYVEHLAGYGNGYGSEYRLKRSEGYGEYVVSKHFEVGGELYEA